VLWPDPIILEVAGKLNQLGLSSCAVCGSDASGGGIVTF
jgi:hypothetical protein